jgi:hypothetical protein
VSANVVVHHVLVVSTAETSFVVRFDSASFFMMATLWIAGCARARSQGTSVEVQPFLLLRSASGMSAFFSSSFAARSRFTEWANDGGSSVASIFTTGSNRASG